MFTAVRTYKYNIKYQSLPPLSPTLSILSSQETVHGIMHKAINVYDLFVA
jgi:hypothetical protein